MFSRLSSLSHLFNQIVKALIVLCLGDSSAFQKRVSCLLLVKEELMVLFVIAEGSPSRIFFVYIHSYHNLVTHSVSPLCAAGSMNPIYAQGRS